MNNEVERLKQIKTIDYLKNNPKTSEMITVCSSEVEEQFNKGIYPVLVPKNITKKIMSGTTWNFNYYNGYPEFFEEDGKIEYFPYGDNQGLEPLVITRNFNDIKDEYIEISQEFILFHHLYYEPKENKYYKIIDGNEYLVIDINEDEVKIRLKEIKEFLKVKNMHLVLQFDMREHSLKKLEELKLSGNDSYKDDSLVYRINYGDFGGFSTNNAFSRLLGKKLITPFQKDISKKENKFVEYIIEIDNNGDEILFTSNPDLLSNGFSSEKNTPDYLTPVFFKKEVLDKYYNQPSKYSISTSMLYCGSLWSMYIDNHQDNIVCVWLGDLGSSLSYEEQLYWRSFNIEPTGSISKTYYEQQILANFTESDYPEHIFKHKYNLLLETSENILGWNFLLPLSKEDEHYFTSLRVPSTNEQKNFDELVLALTKILLDSLNEKELNKLIKSSNISDIKGSINRLEKVLEDNQIVDDENSIVFLRNVQNLRSSSSAHRKGKNYQKIAKEFGIDNKSLSNVFTEILNKSIKILDFYLDIIRQVNKTLERNI
ncbi:MAG: hypothetical protein PHN18_00605 [Sulfurospirillaceae bacterium]|nr:hypothetical protein [Sulfurospirillaceae bacterium]MDD2826161.1 hypothetical protein [Sulfurospirillaceae bacterium]